jgi:hypothetical protein
MSDWIERNEQADEDGRNGIGEPRDRAPAPPANDAGMRLTIAQVQKVLSHFFDLSKLYREQQAIEQITKMLNTCCKHRADSQPTSADAPTVPFTQVPIPQPEPTRLSGAQREKLLELASNYWDRDWDSNLNEQDKLIEYIEAALESCEQSAWAQAIERLRAVADQCAAGGHTSRAKMLIALANEFEEKRDSK